MDGERLIGYFRDLPTGDLCVAFSGGVDSAAVLAGAIRAGRAAHAVYFDTVLHPHGDLDAARDLAQSLGAVFAVLTLDEFTIPQVVHNDPLRCYHCKRALFEALHGYARAHGLGTLIDGTNADDLTVYRPGLRALREQGIDSPLAALGITKEQARAIAGAWGLPVADRPSSPCLATRFPYGTTLTKERLAAVERGEEILRDMGFAVVRLRAHGDIARIEIERDKAPLFLERAADIAEKLKPLGFSYITLDAEFFRSGSMDIYIDR